MCVRVWQVWEQARGSVVSLDHTLAPCVISSGGIDRLHLIETHDLWCLINV